MRIGQRGASAPPAFRLGEQGEQKYPFVKCNRLLSKRQDDATENTHAVVVVYFILSRQL